MSEKKNAVRLIALDMDGTLLNATDKVTEKNRNAIEEAKKHGVEVIISTGRHYSTSSDYAKSLGLTFLITVNGSEIWMTTGDLIDRQLLEIEQVEKLVELQKKHQTWAWMTSTESIWRGEVPKDLAAHQWLKFGFDTESDKIKQAILDELTKNEYLELSNSSDTNIEVNAMGINKAVAIEKVCERLGITMNEVMAVGDSLNDIKMIEAAGIGVAMGNAQDLVKKAADWVTLDNENSGVAEAIEQFVLQKTK